MGDVVNLNKARKAKRRAEARTDAAARPRWPLDAAAALANPTHVPGRKGAKA